VSPSSDRQQNIVWPAVWSVFKLAIHTAGRVNSWRSVVWSVLKLAIYTAILLLSSVVYLFIRPAVGIASVKGDTIHVVLFMVPEKLKCLKYALPKNLNL